jgi:asparagine synthase (glutamine-hydrolysing)
VSEHLLSDVPLGVWLSGGIDSSTVLHYAATASGNRLKTFSISFRGRSFDETGYIRAAAKQYGTDHEEFDVNPEVGLARTPLRNSRITSMNRMRTQARCRSGISPR